MRAVHIYQVCEFLLSVEGVAELTDALTQRPAKLKVFIGWNVLFARLSWRHPLSVPSLGQKGDC